MGYDGGAFFSHDSKKLVFRSSRPKTAEATKDYKDLLAQNLVAPTEMEIYTMNIDGSNLKQVTHLGKALHCHLGSWDFEWEILKKLAEKQFARVS